MTITGTEFLRTLPAASGSRREGLILDAVRAGLALPPRWAEVHAEYEGHHAMLLVSEDAVAIGTPDDHVRVTVSHLTAQRIADHFGASLPTTRIADLAWQQAAVVLTPCTQRNPDGVSSLTSRMLKHHLDVEAKRQSAPGLVRPVGKDWVLTNKLAGRPSKGANYGWHLPSAPNELGSGLKGWQPLALAHSATYTDYSQTVTLVHRDVVVDGETVDLLTVLASPELWGLVSEEGPLSVLRHPGARLTAAPAALEAPFALEAGGVDEVPPGVRALRVAEAELAAGVREKPTGSNSGPRVSEYLAGCVRDFKRNGVVTPRRLELTEGEWCAAFASWCAEQGGGPRPHGWRAAVAELWRDAVAAGASRKPWYAPEVGDLAIFRRDHSDPTHGGKGHVGRVCVPPDGNGLFETVDGNHGDRVSRVRRRLGDDLVGWIACSAEPPAGGAPSGLEAVLAADDGAPDEDAWLLDLAEQLDAADPDAAPDADLDGVAFALESTAATSSSRRFDDLRGEYTALYASAVVAPARLAQVDATARQIASYKARYAAVGDPAGVPWYVVGIIHSLEGSLSFRKHLHNGDPLTARTVHVPAGRPEEGRAPFTWEQSAADALAMTRMPAWRDWSVAGVLYQLERYNGFGYRRVRIPSPYLWSFSNQYARGKFVADGVFDADAVSRQCGAAPLLLRLEALGLVSALPR